jgi:uncharacterized integral membrane protein (TIGR00698 family)
LVLRKLAPGIGLATLVAGAATGVGAIETELVGRAVVEPLVLAILIGMVVRSAMGPSPESEPGIRFVAGRVLEVAVCLLGATMDVPRLFASGPYLAAGIVAIVVAALISGYAIGRLAGLTPKLSILVASGNAICGNSAIAAVAPVIDADREDVAASIALTAVLGVAVVILLPLLIPVLGLSHNQYGVLAGLTVYSVPQVLAAAFAVSAASGQVATVVKLARVLMLGPVVTFFALRSRSGSRASIAALAPWFVIGFVVLAVARSGGFVPDGAARGATHASSWLTIGAMAALGLSVNVRAVQQVGGRVMAAVAASLLVLIGLALALIAMLP